MSRPHTLLFLSLFIVLQPLYQLHAQSDEDKIERKVTRAIEAGNASRLSEHFTNKVDLSTPGTDDVFSKAQAEQILKEFFQEHPPEELILEHQGTSKLKDRYRIGKLVTENGEYRLTYFMKKVDEGSLIKKLRIEPYEGDL